MAGDRGSDAAPGGTYTIGGRAAARVGYGAMQLRSLPDPAAGVALLRRALALGVNHFDTAQFYGDGSVNRMIAEVLRPGDGVVVASKVGAESAPGAVPPIRLAQRPEQLRAGVEANLRELGLEKIPLVYLRRADVGPGLTAEGDQIVSMDDQMAVMTALREEGKIGAIGLSAVSLDGLRRALPAGIAAVQNAYSLVSRKFEGALELCAANHIAWVPFFPLGGAMAGSPRVTDDPKVKAVAARLHATPQQIGLAWLLQRSPNVMLIPGTASLRHLEENVAAGVIALNEEAVVELSSL